jgi:hypothetical protein
MLTWSRQVVGNVTMPWRPVYGKFKTIPAKFWLSYCTYELDTVYGTPMTEKETEPARGNQRGATRRRRRIVVVVVPPIDELDLVGSLQVFTTANRLQGERVYAIELVPRLA